MTHTPGPWLAGKPSSVVGWPVVSTREGRLICNINYVQRSQIDPNVPGDRAFNAESGANARLIAAAPDLLKAAKQLSAVYESIWVKMSDGEMALCRRAWDEMDAAVAKAEGLPHSHSHSEDAAK